MFAGKSLVLLDVFGDYAASYIYITRYLPRSLFVPSAVII
jgi:hypothetical protein